MLLQDQFVQIFYDVVKASHPVILVNMDVDAICALMILANSFNMNDVHYTVVYVDSTATIETRLRGFTDSSKNVILVNCYGHFSLKDEEKLTRVTIAVKVGGAAAERWLEQVEGLDESPKGPC